MGGTASAAISRLSARRGRRTAVTRAGAAPLFSLSVRGALEAGERLQDDPPVVFVILQADNAKYGSRQGEGGLARKRCLDVIGGALLETIR